MTQVEQALAPWLSPHLSPNWMADPYDPDQIARTWPEQTRARLDTVRRRHDPDGVFSPR